MAMGMTYERTLKKETLADERDLRAPKSVS